MGQWDITQACPFPRSLAEEDILEALVQTTYCREPQIGRELFLLARLTSYDYWIIFKLTGIAFVFVLSDRMLPNLHLL